MIRTRSGRDQGIVVLVQQRKGRQARARWIAVGEEIDFAALFPVPHTDAVLLIAHDDNVLEGVEGQQRHHLVVVLQNGNFVLELTTAENLERFVVETKRLFLQVFDALLTPTLLAVLRRGLVLFFRRH